MTMNRFRPFALVLALAGVYSATPVSADPPEGTGAAGPDCPYGYYDVDPYSCAPYGYYGPEWFKKGVFIGAGPWFHGPANFHGRVNGSLDVLQGYHDPLPKTGDKPDPSKPAGKVGGFKATESRDGRGHKV